MISQSQTAHAMMIDIQNKKDEIRELLDINATTDIDNRAIYFALQEEVKQLHKLIAQKLHHDYLSIFDVK